MNRLPITQLSMSARSRDRLGSREGALLTNSQLLSGDRQAFQIQVVAGRIRFPLLDGRPLRADARAEDLDGLEPPSNLSRCLLTKGGDVGELRFFT